MVKKKPMSLRVREMIDRGHNNKTIIEKLGVKPQAVYNIRYQINRERGLGAIGKPAPKPVEGIGMPPKRKYTRKVKAGELASLSPTPHEPLDNMSAQNKRPLPGAYAELPITMVESPTLWERVKGWFRG